MARRKRNRYSLYENVKIVDMASDGKAIGKIDDLVILVEKGVPGDIVDVQTNKKKKGMFHGYITNVHKYSEDRIEAFCSHFGICGGCKWQNLTYEKQLEFKQKHVYDCFDRIGNVEILERKPILGSKKTDFYRNKLEYTFTDKRWLTTEEIDTEKDINSIKGVGFHIPGRFDKVIDIDKCYLQSSPSNEIRLKLKEFVVKNEFEFCNLRTHEGFMRNLIIRTSTTGEVMVIVIFNKNIKDDIDKTMEFLKNEFPIITSLMYVVNDKLNDTIYDLEVINYSGNSFIYEQMEDLKFKISPKSFYQTNSEQAYELYKIVREFADIKDTDTVYDLYTGTGTIANFVARQAKKVIGVECVEDAIKDARVNSEINNISNTTFYVGDMKDILTDSFVNEHGKADVIIVDPPRAGMHKNVVKVLLNANAPKIVYVSCNPATQARDLELLAEKYSVEISQPVDMFPHTHHIENVVLLKLK